MSATSALELRACSGGSSTIGWAHLTREPWLGAQRDHGPLMTCLWLLPLPPRSRVILRKLLEGDLWVAQDVGHIG